MRFNRIHLRAVGDAAVDWQLAIYPGYTVVLTPGVDEGRRLCSVLGALLYPEAGLRTLDEWQGSASGDASLSLDVGSDVCMVSADLGARRIELSRYDASTGRYDHECLGARDVTRHLRRAGLPGAAIFRALCTLGFEIPEVSPDARTEPLNESTSPGARRDVDLARAEARVAVLRADREALTQLESEYKRVFDELESRAALADIVEAADAHIEDYRERVAQLERARDRIRQKRREMLDERSRLTAAPRGYGLPMGIGVAIGLGGAAGSALDPQIGAPIAVAGAAIGGIALVLRQLGGRRRKAVDVEIARLRVRERKEERIFDANAGPVRRLLTQLELDSIEALEAELAEYSRCAAQLDELHRKLTEARMAFPAEAQVDLTRLEETLARPDAVEVLRAQAARQKGAEEARAETEPEADETDDAAGLDMQTPGGLIEAATRASGVAPEELLHRLEATLPQHMLTLTDNALEHADLLDDGWTLRGPQCEGVRLDDLDDAQRDVVLLAFQLALLEALGQEHGLPLLLGPDVPPMDEGDHLLARALRRLGNVVQVLHITPEDESDHWSDHAASVLRLGPNASG